MYIDLTQLDELIYIYTKNMNTILLCIICFIGGCSIGMGILLFIQGASYHPYEIKEERN